MSFISESDYKALENTAKYYENFIEKLTLKTEEELMVLQEYLPDTNEKLGLT